MATPTDCYPWFHAEFAGLVSGPQAKVLSGCSVDGSGNIPCSPESMRANAEMQLRASGWAGSLSLEAYTLSRYMQGEVGSGTIEERVAVGEAAVNRARRENLPGGVIDLLLNRQPQGHPNRGWYGPIHGPGGISSAPYGRWATTSADPTVATLILADFVASGKSGNFSRNADDQDGPEYWAPQGQDALWGYVRREASRGQYWVGPLPGVDHWRTFLQFTPGVNVNTPEGQELLQRGLDALTLPVRRPSWDPSMPVCSKPISIWWWVAGIAGAVWWWRRRKKA